LQKGNVVVSLQLPSPLLDRPNLCGALIDRDHG